MFQPLLTPARFEGHPLIVIDPDLDGLATLYAEALRNKRARVRVIHQAMQGDPPPEEMVQLLTTLMHHLAGSAGAYGFVRLGDWSRQIERITKQWKALCHQPEHPDLPQCRIMFDRCWPVFIDALDDALDRLDAHVAASEAEVA